MRAAYHAESALKAGALLTTGRRTGQDPPRRRRLPAGGHGRDPDRPAAGRAAHARAVAPIDQPGRVKDRDLPGALQERQALAGRHDGPSLARRRGCWRPATSSAASTATCTCPNSGPPSKRTSKLSVPQIRMRIRKQHDHRRGRRRSSTELGTTSDPHRAGRRAELHELRGHMAARGAQVVHTITIAPDASWLGTEQVRDMKPDDDRLMPYGTALVGPPRRRGLEWRRFRGEVDDDVAHEADRAGVLPG